MARAVRHGVHHAAPLAARPGVLGLPCPSCGLAVRFLTRSEFYAAARAAAVAVVATGTLALVGTTTPWWWCSPCARGGALLRA